MDVPGRPARAPRGKSSAVVVACACLAVVVAGAQESKPRPADELSFARLKADAVVAAPMRPGAVATAEAVVLSTEGGLVRVSAKGNQASPAVLTGQSACASLAVGNDAIWAPLCGAGRIARVDEKTSGVGAPLELGPADPAGRIAASVGSVWVATAASGVVSRIDPASGTAVAEIRVAAEPSAVVASGEAVWVTSAAGNLLTHVNAHTNEVVATVKVGPRPGRLAVGEGAVWTLNRGDGSVSRVDPATHKVVATISVGQAAADGEIAAGAGAVWVSAKGLPLVRIDPASNRVAQRFTGDHGGAVLVAHGSLWLAGPAGDTWRVDPQLVVALRP